MKWWKWVMRLGDGGLTAWRGKGRRRAAQEKGENMIERANQRRIRQIPVGATELAHNRLACCRAIGQARPYRGKESLR